MKIDPLIIYWATHTTRDNIVLARRDKDKGKDINDLFYFLSQLLNWKGKMVKIINLYKMQFPLSLGIQIPTWFKGNPHSHISLASDSLVWFATKYVNL